MPLHFRIIVYSTLALLAAFLLTTTFSAKETPVRHNTQDASAMTAANTSLPPLSPTEFGTYNRLADEMTYYHNMLRSTWSKLYTATVSDASQLSSEYIVDLGLQFCQHLKAHHDIEEAYWFPVLGRRMDGFRAGHFASEQHREIHDGLDVLAPYLEACKYGERQLRKVEVRDIMDLFGAVLWRHLDEEVVELGAGNMRKYWTIEEMTMLQL